MHPFSKKLLIWYRANKRDLPWRHTKNAYKIWLSEVIMQQTRVEQGLPYYHRFITQFPTVHDLAAADEETVLKLWQGLGYYSRARNMHHTARQIVMDFEGQFPKKYHDLLSLKGVGEYTAAAITSFANNLPHAVVDGNVFRVLSRLFDIETPTNSPEAKKRFTAVAQELLPPKHAGEFNQAMMEFGALQCKPANPDCSICIFNTDCLALQQSKVSVLPVKKPSAAIKKRYFNYLYISDGSRIWLKQRTEDDIWKNLYDFPCVETNHPLLQENLICHPEFKDLLDENEFSIDSQVTIIHKLTHRAIHATFWSVKVKNDFVLNKNAIFETSFHLLDNFAVSRLIEKYIDSSRVNQ